MFDLNTHANPLRGPSNATSMAVVSTAPLYVSDDGLQCLGTRCFCVLLSGLVPRFVIFNSAFLSQFCWGIATTSKRSVFPLALSPHEK